MHPFLARLGIPENHLFIGGEWVPASSKETDDVRNPMDDSVIGSVALGNGADMDRALAAALLAHLDLPVDFGDGGRVIGLAGFEEFRHAGQAARDVLRARGFARRLGHERAR